MEVLFQKVSGVSIMLWSIPGAAYKSKHYKSVFTGAGRKVLLVKRTHFTTPTGTLLTTLLCSEPQASSPASWTVEVGWLELTIKLIWSRNHPYFIVFLKRMITLSKSTHHQPPTMQLSIIWVTPQVQHKSHDHLLFCFKSSMHASKSPRGQIQIAGLSIFLGMF